jgi:excisionase family DNA binding protein
MIEALELLKIPIQRLFGTKSAANYLGIHEQTLRKYVDLGMIKARRLEKRRVFTLEDLNCFIEDLPRWYPESDGGPGSPER